MGSLLYNKQPRGRQKLGWTNLPQSCMQQSVLCMLNVLLEKTEKRLGRPKRLLKYRSMKAKPAVNIRLQGGSGRSTSCFLMNNTMTAVKLMKVDFHYIHCKHCISELLSLKLQFGL